MQPTQAGEVLLEQARSVLVQAAGLEEAVRRAARGEQGRLAIGFTSSAALHPFVPAVLRRFRETVPNVRMELDEAGTSELVEAILQGRLDAAFVRSPVGIVPGLLVDPVLEEPMVAAFPSGHALAGPETTPLKLQALAREPFVLYRRPAGPGLYDAILTACREAGFNPTVVQEAPRLPSTLSLVAAGLGLSLVPASMRRLAVAGVAYRALANGRGPTAPVHLALRRSGMSPTASRFRSLVRQLAAASERIEARPRPD